MPVHYQHLNNVKDSFIDSVSVKSSSRRFNVQSGFTLIEVLVTIVIISLLVAILLPAIQNAREAARRTNCRGNLKQLGLAVQQYYTAFNIYPPGACIPKAGYTTEFGSWSVHGRLLPFLDEKNMADLINLAVAWDDPSHFDALDNKKISNFICLSDPNSNKTYDPGAGKPKLYPTNYGFNCGTWKVYDGTKAEGGDGMFNPNLGLMQQQIQDGTSTTLLAAEVKSYQAYSRNHGPASTTAPAPNDYTTIVNECTDPGAEKKWDIDNPRMNMGHVEWADGRVHNYGFTTLFSPNSKVLYAPPPPPTKTVNLDYNSWQEGKQDTANSNQVKDSYAAVTARSYHEQSVNVVMMDGSVKTISDGIDNPTWRALGTPKGSNTEIEPSGF